ncbi:hypothetical protein DM860_011782 [Cuscuta australis]|uniref:Uncharacterized protein n=1 Tax=Cuscuta australis TaxID=267555 RepID=A0A328DFC2_9ASTE|nr:hypothetical protein DM860_011782 [Cuscuta australis]
MKYCTLKVLFERFKSEAIKQLKRSTNESIRRDSRIEALGYRGGWLALDVGNKFVGVSYTPRPSHHCALLVTFRWRNLRQSSSDFPSDSRVREVLSSGEAFSLGVCSAVVGFSLGASSMVVVVPKNSDHVLMSTLGPHCTE